MQKEKQLFELGKYYLSINELDLAYSILKEVITSAPDNTNAYELLAQISSLKGDETSAYKFLKQACSSENCSATALYHLSQFHLSSQKYSEAIVLLEESIKKNGKYFEALHDLGTCHANQGALDKAIDFYSQALQIKDDVPELFFNLGRLEDELKNYPKAINYYDKATSLRQNYAEAWSHKGLTLHELGKYEDALTAYETALHLMPNYPEASSYKAVTLHEMRCYTDALTFHDKAIALNPSYNDAYWNKALTQLILGNFQDGWINYEYRWTKLKPQPYKHSNIPPLIANTCLIGKKILVWSEQGYGDTLQFSRYIPLLIESGAQVIFETPKSLLNLLAQNIHCQVVEDYDPKFMADYQAPLLSLPLIFKTSLKSIPPINPVITPSEKSLVKWGKRLSTSNKKINIGIACSGNSQHQNDRNRSMPLINFLPLLSIANLYLIQKDIRQDDAKCLIDHPEIKHLGDDLDDFDDTAAIIDSMDLIISVDTSVAHLAGAMMKSIFILLPFTPEWRWMTEGDASPWYPTIKIYRQSTKGDWKTVIHQIMIDLKLMER